MVQVEGEGTFDWKEGVNNAWKWAYNGTLHIELGPVKGRDRGESLPCENGFLS